MCEHTHKEISVIISSIAESIFAQYWRNSNLCKTYLHSVL